MIYGVIAFLAAFLGLIYWLYRLQMPTVAEGVDMREVPIEEEPPGLEKKWSGVLTRSVIGLCDVSVVEEAAKFGPIPILKKRRLIRVNGHVTNEKDARALSDTIASYAAEL